MSLSTNSFYLRRHGEKQIRLLAFYPEGFGFLPLPSKRGKPPLSLHANDNWTCGYVVPRSSLLAKSNSDHHLEFDNSLRLAITHSRNAVYKLMRGVKRKLMRELKRTGSQCLLWLVAPGWWIQRINSIPEATYLSLSLIQSKWKPWGMHQKYRLLRGALCASWLVQPVLSPSLNSPSVWRLRLWLMLCCVGVSLGSVSCPFPSLSHSASNETE